MKKKANSIIKLFSIMFLSGAMLLMTGCTSLNYSGEDLDKKNISNIQTNELFTFSTYKKAFEDEKVEMKVGVSKTPIPDALVVYVNVKNLSDGDYILYLKDFTIKAGNETLHPVPPSSYIDAYQRFETGTYAGLSNLAPTLGAFANIQNANYQTTGSSTAAQAQADASTSAMTTEIAQIANGITKHSLTSASIIPQGKANFYYIFLKDPMFIPIDVYYKNEKYSFGSVKK